MGEITISLCKKGTDWIQTELLIKEGIKFNSKMKIDIKKVYGDQKRLREE